MFKSRTQNTNKLNPNQTGLFGQKQSDNTFIQPKLNVGKPGDKYEQEADRAADAIVNSSNESVTENTFFKASPSTGKNDTVQNKALVKGVSRGVQLLFDKDVQEKSEEEVQKMEEDQLQTQLAVQRSEEPDTDVEEETLPVQPKSEGKAGDLSSVESKLQSPSPGSSLPEPIKGEMESGFGTDFSGVRVHTDPEAVQMSRDLGAQAFTHGNDIYFNEGKYNTQSDSGKHLLAHELTHTVQQGASVQPKMIQKTGEEEDSGNAAGSGSLSTGLVSNSTSTITYSTIPITAFKLTGGREHLYTQFNLKRHMNYTGSRVGVNQRETWRTELDSTLIRQQLQTMHDEASGVDASQSGSHRIYAFRVGGSETSFLTGTMDNIVGEALTPKWDIEGNTPIYFQVDHIVEMQISGHPGESWVNTIDNLELLERTENSDSGQLIRESVEGRIGLTLNNPDSLAAIEQKFPEIVNISEEEDKVVFVKNRYHLVFQDWESGGGTSSVGNEKYWLRSQIETGDHLEHLEPINMSALGAPDNMLVFPRRYYPIGKQFSWDGSNQSPTQEERWWFHPWVISNKQFYNDTESDVLGHLVLEFPSSDPLIRATGGTAEIKKQPGAQFAGYVDNVDGVNGGRTSIIQAGNIAAKQFSPVRLDDIEFHDNGVFVTGKVLPTMGLIEGLELDLEISDGEVKIFKTFTNESFNFPSPFEIEQSSLTLFGSSTRGLGIEGRVDFSINNVGQGHIGAAASTAGGFELEGAFNFDSELFDPAEISVEYRNDVWTIGGEIGIPEGKVRGVKNATITAEYSEGNFTATGEAELDVPGIERGSMTVNYGDEGFSISGEFDLSSDIPGINGGNVEARVAKEEGAEAYDVFVSGTAQPAIPGIDTELTVTYENGAITISGSATYSRGMLSGNVNIGATNRAIGEEGEPTGEPDDTMRVYGGGDLTLQLTPWLEATAGVQFLPNGEIEVTGRIGLPSTVDVFDRREITRNLFSVPTIEIPLFAIPLGPRSLGLVAQINGGLDFTAGFGPGQLRDVFAEVTYNPDRPEETEIHGHGEFAIPADAGLTLRGDLGLGLSIGIASLTGGIELTGTLGLAGEAAAEVDLSWSPQTGIALDAEGRITVNPLFQFTVNALARATLGVSPFSISEEWRENLAAFEWGPSIEFGIVFPVHYREDQPFEISTDDVEVIYPDLDIVDMAKDLATDVKDQIF